MASKVAVHEAGHAIMGFMKGWPITSVTLIPNKGRDSFGNCDFAEDIRLGLQDVCMVFLGGIAAQRATDLEDANYKDQDDYKTALAQARAIYEPNGYGKFVEADVEKWLSDATTILQHETLNVLLEFATKLQAETTILGSDAMEFLSLHFQIQQTQNKL